MPGLSCSDRLAGSIVFADQMARGEIAIDARGEARLVLADQILGCRGLRGELCRVQMPTARDTVDVLVLMGMPG